MRRQSIQTSFTKTLLTATLSFGLLLLASHAQAAKPGGGGGGGPTGRIHYFFNQVEPIGVLDACYSMAADGSQKAETAWRTPSNQLHQSKRWYLAWGIADESWGFTRSCVDGLMPPVELFLTDAQGTDLQLTHDPEVQLWFGWARDGRGAWAVDDGFASFVGVRRTAVAAGDGNWVDYFGQEWRLEAAFYRVPISWTSNGPVASEPQLLNLQWFVDAGGCDPAPDGGWHDWSPDGNRMVLNRDSTATLHVANVSSGAVSLLVPAPAGAPTWSPDGSRIAFDTGGRRGNTGIFTIRPDGTDRRQVTSHGLDVWDVGPQWSPDSAYLAYARYRDSARPNDIFDLSDIYRVAATGGSPTNLTRDLADNRHLQVIAWVQ